MRRLHPRPLGVALERTLDGLAPATTLARVQSVWAEAVGPTVAEQSEPRSERDGVVLVVCASAVWAQELDLMSTELLAAVHERLSGGDGAGSPRKLRFVSAG